MHPLMTRIQQLWQARNPREQWVLGSGAVILLLLVLIFKIWLPVQRANVRLQQQVPVLQGQLAQMQHEANEWQHLHHTATALPVSGDLGQQLSASAAVHGLRIASLQVADQQQAELVMDDVSFDAWVTWIEALQNENHLFVTSCQIARQPSSNRVHVQVMLSRAGAA